jgi:hypothetical protein
MIVDQPQKNHFVNFIYMLVDNKAVEFMDE